MLQLATAPKQVLIINMFRIFSTAASHCKWGPSLQTASHIKLQSGFCDFIFTVMLGYQNCPTGIHQGILLVIYIYILRTRKYLLVLGAKIMMLICLKICYS